MKDAQTYKQYAAECLRIARMMSGEHRSSLLAIAEAWLELAREAERQCETCSRSERCNTMKDRQDLALRRAEECEREAAKPRKCVLARTLAGLSEAMARTRG
jgi:hypothetical protein